MNDANFDMLKNSKRKRARSVGHEENSRTRHGSVKTRNEEEMREKDKRVQAALLAVERNTFTLKRSRAASIRSTFGETRPVVRVPGTCSKQSVRKVSQLIGKFEKCSKSEWPRLIFYGILDAVVKHPKATRMRNLISRKGRKKTLAKNANKWRSFKGFFKKSIDNDKYRLELQKFLVNQDTEHSQTKGHKNYLLVKGRAYVNIIFEEVLGFPLPAHYFYNINLVHLVCDIFKRCERKGIKRTLELSDSYKRTFWGRFRVQANQLLYLLHKNFELKQTLRTLKKAKENGNFVPKGLCQALQKDICEFPEQYQTDKRIRGFNLETVNYLPEYPEYLASLKLIPEDIKPRQQYYDSM